MNPFDKKDVAVPKWLLWFLKFGCWIGFVKKFESVDMVKADGFGFGALVRGYKFRGKIYIMSWEPFNHNQFRGGS